MRVAYIRVSSVDQNTGRQFEALKNHEIEKTYEEKISGKDTNRPQLKAMMEFVREGDSIYIESISRLARNTLDFLRIVEELSQKKVGLISLKENIDTSTPQGRFMLSVCGALSQMELETIRQRQREGVDLALANGKKFGRPRIAITDQYVAIHKKWQMGEITATMAMQLIGMKRNTFYKLSAELLKMAK
jgi:DNA invertase Pin-like site-specific DNA recombinase